MNAGAARPTAEPARPEPSSFREPIWRRRLRSFTAWLKAWAPVISLGLGGILLLSTLVTCGIGGYVSSLNKRIDDQYNAIQTQGTTVTDRIDLQTQSVKDVLTEKISGESSVLTIKIDHVNEKLDSINDRLDHVDARIDRVATTDVSREGMAARQDDVDDS